MATVVPPTAVGLSNNQDIDGLLWGWRWGPGGGLTLTYSFPAAVGEYTGYVAINGFSAFNAAQQAAVQRALANISSFSGLTFAQTANPGATLRFGNATDIDYSNDPTVVPPFRTGPRMPGGGTGEANPPELAFNGNPPVSAPYAQGDAWFTAGRFTNPLLGGYQDFTVLHEIGHNLGLKHGHITQTGHGITFPTLPSNRDGFEYSVMTYRQFPGNPIQAFNNPNFPTTFMQDDIAALQYLYGARYGGGPNTYTWSPTTGEEFINGVGQGVPASNVVFMTVWDGSGSATYNFSNYTTNMSINLNPGQWTILDTSGAQRADLGNDGAGGPPRFAIGNIANALIDPNDPTETTSLIRNVIAGSGNDTIVGNAANDTLVGGAGDDIISAPGNGNNSLDAGIGNDQLYATGLGNNTLVGGDGNDTVAASGNGNNSLSGGNGIDALYATGNGNETLDGGDGTDTLAANGSGRNVLIGGAGNDQLFVVGSGTNSLLGGAGDDLLADGGTGNDTLDGSQSSAASEFAGRGSDTLIGGAGADVLVAGTGNNQSISGGGGTDLFVYSRTDTGNNTAGTGTGDTMVGGSGGGNIVQLIGFTTGQVTVTRGTAGAATITFSGSGNVLNVQRISVLQFDNGNVSL